MASDAPPRRRWPLRVDGGLVGAAALYFALAVFAGPNEHAVLPGRVYRSAQLSGGKLARVIESKGVRTVLNLRGPGAGLASPRNRWYADEVTATHAASVSQFDVSLSASSLPSPAELRRVLDVLDHAEGPILVHCKQGADRTGLVSAIARLLYSGDTVAQARQELWPVYGHFPAGRTRAMDDFLDRYESWLAAQGEAHAPERFRHWADAVYAPGPARSRLEWLTPAPFAARVGGPILLKLRATNTSAESWEFSPANYAGIHLLYRVTADPQTEYHRGQAGLLRRTVPPGASIEFDVAIPPSATPIRLFVQAELIDARGAAISFRSQSFVKFGDEPAAVEVAVE